MDRQHDVLSFQRLDVYQCAVEFLAISIDVSTRLPKGYAALADQLRRSALSVPLNIAEGAGRMSKADAARHYAIARGSAMECAAIVDALKLLENDYRASARASPRSPGPHGRNAHQALLTTVAVAVAVAVNVNGPTRPLSYRSLSP